MNLRLHCFPAIMIFTLLLSYVEKVSAQQIYEQTVVFNSTAHSVPQPLEFDKLHPYIGKITKVVFSIDAQIIGGLSVSNLSDKDNTSLFSITSNFAFRAGNDVISSNILYSGLKEQTFSPYQKSVEVYFDDTEVLSDSITIKDEDLRLEFFYAESFGDKFELKYRGAAIHSVLFSLMQISTLPTHINGIATLKIYYHPTPT